ncbi:MAG: DUF2778 domain-containing protein [Azoarcus sp.]|jgi:hypothetical protein|nr:DUF2778 domain-containing protein [Azoarcus sp.]
MPWTYEQSTGQLRRPDGVLFHVGYSGLDWAKNQPVLQHIEDMGPIPRGRWVMVRWETGHRASPSGVIRLEPQSATQQVFDRGGFLIHGDDSEGRASQGCIIVSPLSKRRQIWDNGDRFLDVVQ